MGVYVNPGNGAFAEIRKDDYIDKSGLIPVINDTLGTGRRLSCVSRPRRFGKTYAANMLVAYYDRGCDSSKLFDNLKIADDAGYRKHMNKYNVLYLDIASFMSEVSKKIEVVPLIKREVLNDLRDTFGVGTKDDILANILKVCVDRDGGRQFIAIIDEWDAPIRDSESTEKSQKEYLEFLRGLFKNGSLTKQVFAGAYMTGILPVKKDGSQSPLSEFEEYTVIEPEAMAPYVGFTESEVRDICGRYEVSFDMMKEWYDGYRMSDGQTVMEIYNSNSVMKAALKGQFKSYWRKSSAVNGLSHFINMDFDGLADSAEKLIAGLMVPVKVTGFQNDMVTFESADDVLTLLVHLGYLTYDSDAETVYVPNNEVRLEFADLIHSISHADTIKRVAECEKCISDVIAMDECAVADYIEKVHKRESSMRYYNNEQALRAVIKLAFFTYRDHFIKLEEPDAGLGYADIIFFPKKNAGYPVLVVELKYDDTAENGIDQMKSRDYADVVADYGSDILLVCVSYDKDDKGKKHHCRIEKYKRL